MEYIFESSARKIHTVPDKFCRYLMDKIHWDKRLTGIRGARGVGKTTLMLQYLKKNVEPGTGLYVSLDNIWFGENRLIDLADTFSKKGGKYLFLDEVHKYSDWSREIKNIYDDYRDLNVIFSGSSMLEILTAKSDLSRRAINYNLKGLSFREFLNILLEKNFPVFTLKEILKNHTSIVKSILNDVRPFKYFERYLKTGHYPFFTEGEDVYLDKLEEVVKLIIEVELPQLRGIDAVYIPKIRQLLQIIAQSVPFMPNISKLSERIGINRNTLALYLNYLDEAGITRNLYREAAGITRLQKPEKIFLENTNLMFAFKNSLPEKGNVRETFFINQLSENHQVTYTRMGEFIVDEYYTFEIGGKTKNQDQISNIQNSYLVIDDVEYGSKNKIPLWLFGFLY